MIHNNSFIAKSAIIGKDVKIGPFCYIGENVKIGNNTELKSHVVLEGHTDIGENNIIFPFASIGHVPQDRKYSGEKSRLIIGNNNMIREYTTMQPGTALDNMITIVGSNSLFMAATHIAHDCEVGDYATFSNQATLAGHVKVGKNVRISGLSAIHQRIEIGDNAIVGGMSGVTEHIIPYGMVIGNRAHLEGLNVVGMRRAGISNEEINALKEAVSIIFDNESDMLFDKRLEKIQANYSNFPSTVEVIEFIKRNQDKALCKPSKVLR